MGAPIRQHPTAKKRARFLAALAGCGNVTRAAEAAGIHRDTAYAWRHADPAFAADWDSAFDEAAPVLEEEAFRRAHDGVEEPLTCGKGLVLDADGVPVTVHRYSDTLLMFLLKGVKPEKYRENVRHSGAVSLTHDFSHIPDTPEAAAAASDFIAHLTSGAGSGTQNAGRSGVSGE